MGIPQRPERVFYFSGIVHNRGWQSFYFSCWSEKIKPNSAVPTLAIKRKPISNFQANTNPPLVWLISLNDNNINDSLVNGAGIFQNKSLSVAGRSCWVSQLFMDETCEIIKPAASKTHASSLLRGKPKCRSEDRHPRKNCFRMLLDHAFSWPLTLRR